MDKVEVKAEDKTEIKTPVSEPVEEKKPDVEKSSGEENENPSQEDDLKAD